MMVIRETAVPRLFVCTAQAWLYGPSVGTDKSVAGVETLGKTVKTPLAVDGEYQGTVDSVGALKAVQ